MRIALIGIGQAGGKIADRLLEYDENRGGGFVNECLAVNTARQDLQGITNIPEENRLLIGESYVRGGGVGADNDQGREIMEKEADNVIGCLDEFSMYEIDAFVLVAGLGGGTGSGGIPVLADRIKQAFDEKVYGLGVLPTEKEGKIYTLNAARSLEACAETIDNLLLFDNNQWTRGKQSESEWYNEVNTEIAKRFGMLFGAGEFEDGDTIAESVVDASEVINTLESGGLSVVAYSETEIDDSVTNPGLLTRLRGGVDVDKGRATSRIHNLVKTSMRGRLTCPAGVDSTERGLVVVSGPQSHLTRQGMERGRTLVEDKTDSMEVRSGDYPVDGRSYVSAAVLLSGVYDVPRVNKLQRMAVETSDQIEKARAKQEDKLEELLVNEDSEELDSLMSEME